MIYFLTVNYYSTELITKLLTSIKDDVYYQFIIVNNSPDDHSIYQLQKDNVIIIPSPENLGFGGGCNLGLNWIYNQNNQGIVWLINPDTYFTNNCLEKVQEILTLNPQISITGTIIYTPDHKIWFAGGIFNPNTGEILPVNNPLQLLLRREFYPPQPPVEREFVPPLLQEESCYISTQWITGCSMILNLRNLPECPYFDTAYFLYYEDFDFCMRYGKLGHMIVLLTNISIVHQPSSITSKNVYNQLKYSSYSYLLTLQKYTNKYVLFVRIIKMLLLGLILLPFKPNYALGKFQGILSYILKYQK